MTEKLGVARVRATYPAKNMAVVTHRMGEVHYVVFYNNIMGRPKNYILSEGEFILFDPEEVESVGKTYPRIKKFLLLSDYVKQLSERQYTAKSQTGSILFQGSLAGLKELAKSKSLEDLVISIK